MEDNTPNTSPKQSKTVLIVILIVAALAVAGVAALILANPSSAPKTTDSTSNSSDVSEAGTITFTDDGFSPSTLTVKKGTKVTVVNKSSSPVQFSSGQHPTHREDPEINMSELAPGERGSFTVTVAGTHSFHDHLNASKTGTLVVTE